MKVLVKDFDFDIPQWNGESFLLFEEGELVPQWMEDWDATSKVVALGRYRSAGWGTEPHDGDWSEVPVSDIQLLDYLIED